ncbi:MAG: hypothetical protein WD067_01190, partial [Gaiellaceae bacterium]
GPAAVAVHDDRDGLGEIGLRKDGQQASRCLRTAGIDAPQARIPAVARRRFSAEAFIAGAPGARAPRAEAEET